MITDYKIISIPFSAVSDPLSTFEELVKKYYLNGWEPIGSVYIGSGVIRREMIRRGDPEKPKKVPAEIPTYFMDHAKRLAKEVEKIFPETKRLHTEARLIKWAKEFVAMEKNSDLRGYTVGQIIDEVFSDFRNDGFCWAKNIRSAATLRQRWDEGKLSGLFSKKTGNVADWD